MVNLANEDAPPHVSLADNVYFYWYSSRWKLGATVSLLRKVTRPM